MTILAAAFGRVGIVLTAAALAGFAGGRALFPASNAMRPERIGWGALTGFASLAAVEAVCLVSGIRPAILAFAAGLLATAAVGRIFPAKNGPPPVSASNAGGESQRPFGAVDALLMSAAAAGVLLYLLRAATEPMWSNDYLAIWGLKGKTIFTTEGLPPWLRDSEIAGFSHPEYPLGLPLLFAAVSAILSRWDDHALSLLYPAIALATLAVLYGWLTRRGASRRVALTACALLALFEPLYSSFLTGLAEVPLAATMLLVGTALSDALDGTDPSAGRRLAVAAFLAASLKNEGLFLGAAASVVALAGPGMWRRRTAIAATALVPALAACLLGRLASGPAPLRDFDIGILLSGRTADLVSRIASAFGTAIDMAAPAWLGLLAAVVLVGCGRRSAGADRLLFLALACVAVYVALPALAVRGPEWLARTTLYRTSAALAPLAAAGIAGRFAPAPALKRK